jgi:hypothetical protein
MYCCFVLQVKVEVNYIPLHVGEVMTTLIAECSELGVFPMDLQLTCLPATREQPTVFETVFGSFVKKPIVVKNYSRQTATFTCLVSHSHSLSSAQL